MASIIYDGRNVKHEMELPYLDNYYSDYLQLSFYYKKGDIIVAYYGYQEDDMGNVYAQEIAMNLAHFPRSIRFKFQFRWMIGRFNEVWLHEYLHLIGLTDDALKIIKKKGFPIA